MKRYDLIRHPVRGTDMKVRKQGPWVKHATAKKQKADLLHVIQLAYLKHHCDSDVIGWDELSDVLVDCLCNTMGEKQFADWFKEVTKKP